MEGLGMKIEPKIREVEENNGFLGVPNEAEISEREFSRERMQTGFLEGREALDGGAEIDVIVLRDHLSTEDREEILAEAEEIPEHVEGVAKKIFPIFMDAISQGAAEGWDTVADKPSELFIERVGANIEKMVKERAPGWKEADIVYDLLRSEPFPLQNEREQKMKAALLKRASSGKYAH